MFIACVDMSVKCVCNTFLLFSSFLGTNTARDDFRVQL